MCADTNKAYPAFKFYVEIGSITVAGFVECSGLESEVHVEPYEEGGFNDFVYKLPGRVKHADLVLRYGTAEKDQLWDWYQNVCRGNGQFERKAITVTMYDCDGSVVWRWNFREAYPVKWVGPQFRADQNTVAIESLTIAHHGFERVK